MIRGAGEGSIPSIRHGTRETAKNARVTLWYVVYQMPIDGKDAEMDSGIETTEPKSAGAASRLAVKPIDTTTSFRMQAYRSLKRAIPR